MSFRRFHLSPMTIIFAPSSALNDVDFIKKMPHPNKKQKLDANNSMIATDNDDNEGASFDLLSTDEIALIFGYLTAQNIMCARLNRKMRDASIKTIVPIIRNDKFWGGFVVHNERKYNALAAMATALPNLQQIYIPSNGPSYNDGEEPYPTHAAEIANIERKNIEVLSSFRMLNELRIWQAPLNGRYPCLFNFPLLQELNISFTPQLKWDLAMLAGLPSLTKLNIMCSSGVTGNINSLRVLRDTIAYVSLCRCSGVGGNLMDLADFPRLKFLVLTGMAVIGDIREVSESDFRSLETLSCDSVYGAMNYEFQSISDASHIAADVFDLQKHHPRLKLENWCARLSYDSPDWYCGRPNERVPGPPFAIVVVTVGLRRGWRWEWKDDDNFVSHPCEVNWLDPEPKNGSNDYERYIDELTMIEENLGVYKGCHRPPTKDEYNHIMEGLI